MKIALSLIKEFLKVDLPTKEIASALTMLGIEVEKEEQGILEISLTPNLGHCMSALGIARELAAAIDKRVEIVEAKYEESDLTFPMQVSVEDQRCYRYAGKIVYDIKTVSSPAWLKKVLEDSGIHSVNLIVDVANYIMIKFGEPLHVFDLDLLEGGKIRVTREKEGKSFIGLDQKEYKIPLDAIVIRDAKKAVAIAGIIGGANSSVSEKTKAVLIEAALFDMSAIQKTSKALGLKTESSLRFERGIDPNVIPLALNEAASLMQKLSHSSIAKNRIDIREQDFLPLKLCLHVKRVNELLGTQLSLSEMESLLHRLEFKTEIQKNNLTVLAPTYRHDISSEIDLVEEIARIYGYNNIPKKKSLYAISSIAKAPSIAFEGLLRKRLVSLGLKEFITSDLISYGLATISTTDPIEVLHAKSSETAYLRSSLLPGLLQVVKFNLDRKNLNIAGFEVGRVYFKKENYEEQPTVSIIISGSLLPHFWKEKDIDADFFTLKGILETLFYALNIKNSSFKKIANSSFHPGRTAEISFGEKRGGIIGEVDVDVLKKLDIKKRVFFTELNLHTLMEMAKRNEQVLEISPFPSTERDLTIPLPKNSSIDEIFKLMQKEESDILENFFLLDLYETEEKKNATFRFIFRNKTKTITFEEVESAFSNFKLKIENQLTKMNR